MSEFDFDPVPPEIQHRQTLEEARERTYSECKHSHPETHELYVRLRYLAECVDDLHDTLWRCMRDEQTHQEQLSAAWSALVRRGAPTSRLVGDFLRLEAAMREIRPHFIASLVATTDFWPKKEDKQS